jgi:pSer/pThr/pTyr-binding forkhead associated (FHA) protein
MRLGDDQFCEDCGFDFLDPNAIAEAEVEVEAPEPTTPIDDERPTWSAVVTADRERYDRNAPDDIAFPDDLEARIVVLDRDCVRIGRRSEGRDTHPEIDLAGPPMDTAVSRVHAVLNRQGDGSYVLVDMGSANGTTVNDDGTPLPEGESRPLRHGDEIHVGAWTTITILRDPEPD